MPVYAVGDVQGCYDELLDLLARLGFNANTDRLWLTGDLVNRGPKSLAVLRFVKSLGECAVTVLGNHDLHLLAVAAGCEAPRRKDTLAEILRAPDREVLLDWLRQRPLLHHDESLAVTLIHAGMPPQWDLTAARACAAEVEAALRAPDYADFLQHMYGDRPSAWEPGLNGWDRLRFITNCLTRLRYCDADGRLALKEKAPPGAQAEPFMPWFRVPGRASAGDRIVFGHWSTLGYLNDANVVALDTGCLWGGGLTGVRIDGEPRPTTVPCRGSVRPRGT